MGPLNILVTGATGFIGSHLCEMLEKNGHKVFALVRDKTKFSSKNIKGIPILGSLAYSADNDWIEELPKNLDVVIHTAGLTHSFEEKNFYLTNYKKTVKLISDFEEKYEKLHFILLSSLSASGPTKNKDYTLESDTPMPVCHYGNSKLLSEIALQTSKAKEWKKTIVRPSMVIGPKDPGMLDVFKMVKSGLVLFPGINGQNKSYSFVSVFDLNALVYKIICYPPFKNRTEIYFAAHPTPVKYKEIIDSIKGVMKKEKTLNIGLPVFTLKILAKALALIHAIYPKMNFRLTPDKISGIKPNSWVCSSSKSQKDLEMHYKWDLNSTIKDTFSNYQNEKQI